MESIETERDKVITEIAEFLDEKGFDQKIADRAMLDLVMGRMLTFGATPERFKEFTEKLNEEYKDYWEGNQKVFGQLEKMAQDLITQLQKCVK